MHALALGPLALALFVSGCVSIPQPEPADWLATGFRTPEQTFRTFQTAFAGDQASLEYRCFSREFKRRLDPNFTELAYREYRAGLLADQPATKYLAIAELLERSELTDGRVRLVARVDVLWFEEYFEIILVQESFRRVQAGDAVLLAEDIPNIGAVTEVDADSGSIWVWLPGIEGIEPAEFSEILVATDWKIDAFRQLPAP
ncbi:MAG: hypothetical protein WD226_10695 [Planctomycetota bacterium]